MQRNEFSNITMYQQLPRKKFDKKETYLKIDLIIKRHSDDGVAIIAQLIEFRYCIYKHDKAGQEKALELIKDLVRNKYDKLTYDELMAFVKNQNPVFKEDITQHFKQLLNSLKPIDQLKLFYLLADQPQVIKFLFAHKIMIPQTFDPLIDPYKLENLQRFFTTIISEVDRQAGLQKFLLEQQKKQQHINTRQNTITDEVEQIVTPLRKAEKNNNIMLESFEDEKSVLGDSNVLEEELFSQHVFQTEANEELSTDGLAHRKLTSRSGSLLNEDIASPSLQLRRSISHNGQINGRLVELDPIQTVLGTKQARHLYRKSYVDIEYLTALSNDKVCTILAKQWFFDILDKISITNIKDLHTLFNDTHTMVMQFFVYMRLYNHNYIKNIADDFKLKRISSEVYAKIMLLSEAAKGAILSTGNNKVKRHEVAEAQMLMGMHIRVSMFFMFMANLYGEEIGRLGKFTIIDNTSTPEIDGKVVQVVKNSYKKHSALIQSLGLVRQDTDMFRLENLPKQSHGGEQQSNDNLRREQLTHAVQLLNQQFLKLRSKNVNYGQVLDIITALEHEAISKIS